MVIGTAVPVFDENKILHNSVAEDVPSTITDEMELMTQTCEPFPDSDESISSTTNLIELAMLESGIQDELTVVNGNSEAANLTSTYYTKRMSS